jgi:hypothetical protein
MAELVFLVLLAEYLLTMLAAVVAQHSLILEPQVLAVSVAAATVLNIMAAQQ